MNLLEDNKRKWEFFQKHHWVSPDFSLSPILQSWERCSKQCSAYNWSKPHVASGYTLKSLLRRNETVISCATTVVEDTYDLMSSQDVVFVVTDDNGCVLLSLGEIALSHELHNMGIKDGSFLSEGIIGTNAVSVVLNSHVIAEVIGAEHFNQHLHKYAMSSAPIFDTYGRLRGTISLITRTADYLVSSNVVVNSCAREISSQIHIQMEQENSNKLSCTHNATLECMDDGLLIWDVDNKIIKANKQAEELLKINSLEIIDQEVHSIVRFPPNIIDSIANRKIIRRKQTTVEVKDIFVEAIITLRPLSDGGNMLFIHPIDKIRELAQQQIGGSAKYTFSGLVSASRKMKHTIALAKRSIKSNSPIFITGEEGVGKSDLAMAIHNESDYKEGPFIVLNCRGLGSEQAQREILGYDDDGNGGLPSKFELAHNGSLYLEKIEHLEPELQGALLKLLKTGLVSRSNSQRLIPVRFQLITSTTSDINEYVANRSFGRQLYYEISSNELNIPPLRKRKEDIEYTVMNIVSNYERRHNVAISVEKKVMDALSNYYWSGNNSELKNRMERILLNRSSNFICAEDIPEEIKLNCLDNNSKKNTSVMSLEEVEKKAILQAWRTYDGKMQAMATALKIGRTTLWRKIQKYGLKEE